jgi:hypothetical protein
MGLVVSGGVLRGADGFDPMKTYSETFKKKMVVRMTGPKAISATAGLALSLTARPWSASLGTG